MTDSEAAMPSGFEVMDPYGPFGSLVGPLWVRRSERGATVGLLQEVKHGNRAGMLHGGMFTTLADTATNYAAMLTVEPPNYCVTTGFTLDLLGSAKAGSWVEARAEIVRASKRNICVTCLVYRGDEIIGRASATFQVIAPRGSGNH